MKTRSTHLSPEVGGAEEAGERVADEDQLVRRHDEALAPGHEDAGRLVALHAAEEHVDGVGQAGEVGQALGRVEGEQLRVLQRQGHGQSRGLGHLGEERRKRCFQCPQSNVELPFRAILVMD